MSQKKLNVMISSRCDVDFSDGKGGTSPLSDIRKSIKKEIESEKFLGSPLVNVWINEEEVGDQNETSWDECVQQARSCDLFISLFDGEAGWQVDGAGIGICHAEFEAAFQRAPGKVKVIRLAMSSSGKPKVKSNPDIRFLTSLDSANLFEVRNITDAEKLRKKILQVIREMVLKLSHEGSRELAKSGPNSGAALDWSRLNYQERSNAMKDAIAEFLNAKSGANQQRQGVSVTLDGKSIHFLPAACPAALSISAAREMVGQPFLRDHQFADISSVYGPVHLIACHKSATETQAIQLLGFPDAIIVSGSFGVYVADKVQKIQLCLIANCRDSSSTKHGLQRLFEWLIRTEEDKALVKRAVARRKIISAIAKEM